MQFKHKIIDTDILIVGSGCAGQGAALEAAKLGQRVVVVDKGQRIGRGGASVMALQLTCAALSIWDEDSPELHAEDTLKCGRRLNSPKIVQRMVERAPDRILEFSKWGMKFATKEGKLAQVASPGHSRKRALYVDFKYGTGRSMMKALSGQLRGYPNIHMIGNTYILDLLMEGKQVAGAVGFDVSVGQIIGFRSKVVILATGGGMEVFGRNSGSRNLTGDGYRLAYRAGASLLDMEFVQFVPMGTLYPQLPGMPMVIMEPLSYRTGGRVTNGLGEEFLDRYNLQGLEATRDIISYAMTKEVLEGRGTPHGGIFFQPGAEGAEKLYEEYGEEFIEQFKRIGVDITNETFEVYPIAHYFMGGIGTDEDGRSSVPGLFAVGETTGGIHGANRLAGNALTDVMVMGQVVGECAARESAASAHLSANTEDLCVRTAEKVSARLQNPPDTGVSVIELMERLQREMMEYAGPVRTGKGLSSALENILELEEHFLDPIGVSGDNPVFNRELTDIFDLESMLVTAKLVVRAALERQESRGAHGREDFEGEREEWACNIALIRDERSAVPRIEKISPAEMS